MSKLTEIFNPRFTTSEYEESYTRDHKTFEIIYDDGKKPAPLRVFGVIYVSGKVLKVTWTEYGICYRDGKKYPDGDLIRPHYVDNDIAKRLVLGMITVLIVILLTSIF